jgi:hypothetical protein
MVTERLAKELHEAGRVAVEASATGIKFLEWHEITDQAREECRIQARYLLERYEISKRDALKKLRW